MGKRKRRKPRPESAPAPAAIEPDRRGGWRPIVRTHGAPIGMLLLATVVVWLLQAPATPLDLNSDMHNICAVAAGKADPARYAADHYLCDMSRFAHYIPGYVWMIQCLTAVAGGAPAGVWLLVLPTGLLFVVGMYLLLWRVTGGRALAVGLTFVLAFARIWFQLGEKWSMCETWGMMPRTQYTAFLPWLLLAMWEARYRVRYWPGLAAFAALLTYVHPLSAPPWGFAIWCGLVLGTGDRNPVKVRLKWGAIAALVAVVVAAPSLKAQLLPRLKPRAKPVAAATTDNAAEASAEAKRQELEAIREARYSPGLMDLRSGFADVWRDIVGKNPGRMPRFDHRWMALWGLIWAVTGVIVGVRASPTRRGLLLLSIVLVVFLVPTLGLSLADSVRADAAGVRPTWYDLSRGIRFWPFWLVLIGAAGSGAVARVGDGATPRQRLMGWLVPLLAVPTACLAFAVQLGEGAGRLVIGEDDADAERDAALLEALAFVDQNTPVDAGFIVPRNLFWVRHTPGRPVCHSWKEGTTLSHRYREATAWRDREEQTKLFDLKDRQLVAAWRHLASDPPPAEEANRRWQELTQAQYQLWQAKTVAWQSWGAEYVLQPRWKRPPKPLSVEFENKYWFVARVAPPRATP